MIFFDLINLKKIRRALLYACCVIVTLVLQSCIFSRVEIFGAKAMFVPAVVVAIGLFEGGVWGGLFGLAAGYFCDMSFSANSVLFLVLFAAIGFFTGVLADFFINRRFVSYLIVVSAALFVCPVLQIIPLWVYDGTPLAALMPTVCLQTLWSIPLAVPAYFAAKAIANRDKDEN